MGYINRSTCDNCQSWIDQPKTIAPKRLCAICLGPMQVINLPSGTTPYELPSKVVPQIPACGLVDEFGFPLPKKEEISVEDLILVKGFLGNLKDQTLSRSTHRVLQDLLQRL